MDTTSQDDAKTEHRRIYTRIAKTLDYASSMERLGDDESERIGLKRALELLLDLLSPGWYPIGGEEGGDGGHGVELDGMREMSREVQDIPQAREAEEEGSPQAHVVPVVQVRDTASGEVLTLAPKAMPDASHHGVNGDNPKRGVKPRTFRLYSIDEDGADVALVDEGTAAELASRNDIGPSTVYKRAGKKPTPGGKWRVENVR